MKSTGMTRRIDELGRLVIPKEIRKNLKIRDNEILEIYTKEDKIILQKYSNIDEMEEVLEKYIEILDKLIGKSIFITDKSKIVGCSKIKKEDYLNKEISNFLESFLNIRNTVIQSNIEIIDKKEETGYFLISPLIVNSDVIGLIIMSSSNQISEKDKMTFEIVSKILSLYME